MKFSRVFCLVIVLLTLILSNQNVEAQFFKRLRNFFRPMMRPFMPIFRPMRKFLGLRSSRPRFRDDGTQRPQATGRDEVNPSDCGRDPGKGTGKLCFPDGQLCQQSKIKKPMIFYEAYLQCHHAIVYPIQHIFKVVFVHFE